MKPMQLFVSVNFFFSFSGNFFGFSLFFSLFVFIITIKARFSVFKIKSNNNNNNNNVPIWWGRSICVRSAIQSLPGVLHRPLGVGQR
jgi:hypothetical protein